MGSGWCRRVVISTSINWGRNGTSKIPQLGEGKADKANDAEGELHAGKTMTHTQVIGGSQQYSRRGKSAITFFVSAEAKPKIRAALADAGYGCSYQEGITNMLQDLLEQQGRDPKL